MEVAYKFWENNTFIVLFGVHNITHVNCGAKMDE